MFTDNMQFKKSKIILQLCLGFYRNPLVRGEVKSDLNSLVNYTFIMVPNVSFTRCPPVKLDSVTIFSQTKKTKILSLNLDLDKHKFHRSSFSE